MVRPAATRFWITWENQRRNRELAAALGMPLMEWSDIDRIKSRFRKYAVGISRTFGLLLRTRPRLIVCQNPSIVLAALAVVSKPVTGAAVVIDAHNAGLKPGIAGWPILDTIARWIQRRADLTLVSNAELADVVRANGGRGFVLPDRIPQIHETPAAVSIEPNSILFVCTFAADEPWENVIAAARQLPPDQVVYISGNYKKKGLSPQQFPSNIRLTGYIPEAEYVGLLAAATVVMDLTDRENCLVCGAYEALSFGKPMILSDTRANRRYFSAGAVYAKHDVESLRTAMSEALGRRESLARAAVALRVTRTTEWDGLLAQLHHELQALPGQG